MSILFKNGTVLDYASNTEEIFDLLINDEGKRIKHPVHRLVAITYIPNPDNLPLVNHKDENKQNNNINNLEWVTVQQNTIYSEPWLKRKRDNKGRFI